MPPPFLPAKTLIRQYPSKTLGTLYSPCPRTSQRLSTALRYNHLRTSRRVISQGTPQPQTLQNKMGKRKGNGEYNDFLDGEKLQDNTEIRTTLQGPPTSSTSTDVCAAVGPRRRDDGKSKPTSQFQQASGAPKRPPLTHFLCLPLVNEHTRQSLEHGLSKLGTELERDGVVPRKAVRPVGTLHLTLGVMSLDEDRLKEAIECLQTLDLQAWLKDVASQPPALGSPASAHGLVIQLKALVPMHQPQRTSILYAEPVDASGRLYPFAERLRKEFVARGLVGDENRALRLHATIVNTIYAKSRMERAQGGRSKGLMQFDAREVIKRYEGFVWAEDVRIDRVQICKMGAKKVLDERGEVVAEEYESVVEMAI
ncbi:hypothetical protein P154DRAFT_353011 [Amniculicola lignicola CBS 123094]|uniref:A-kinase anchor protein 7-like phosphoesterase domain-containing protein n=1 Tax=Amniculicola lignicola CBS 123094 TaxID=1392246 RepID=A0A6A5WVE2_9PLEO|nr:hypothetical protein P154DRAFT_353011 [Amniculicola lignicola CBS 123094]